MFRYLFITHLLFNDGGLGLYNNYSNLNTKLEDCDDPRRQIARIEEEILNDTNCPEVIDGKIENSSINNPRFVNTVIVTNIIYLGYNPKLKQ